MKRNLNVKEKAKYLLLSAQTALLGLSIPTIGHAAGFSKVTINQGALQDADPFEMLGGAVGIVLTLVQVMGLGLVIFGAVSISQALSEDQPDKRVKGFTLIASGAILIGLKWILKGMGLIA